MTVIVNMHDAKTQLSKLVKRASLGEEIFIAKNGKPVARLMPMATPGRTRPMGTYEGKIVVHDDFNDPLPEEYGGTKE